MAEAADHLMERVVQAVPRPVMRQHPAVAADGGALVVLHHLLAVAAVAVCLLVG